MIFDEKEYKQNLEKEKILTMEWLELNAQLESLTAELLAIKDQNATVMSDMKSFVQKNFVDLEATVFIMNTFQGYTLREISTKLGFSYDHIRRIKSKITRKLKNKSCHNEATYK